MLVEDEYDVDVYISGVSLHASEIKQRTVTEVWWMSISAAVIVLAYFLFVTRSFRAILFSVSTIVAAAAGGIVLSQASVGLPHIIGLTMATTAIGICIDFSFHFWIHVRSGLNGQTAITSIKNGLNMGFATTAISLIAISFITIPVLRKTAIFIVGALLVSWLCVLFIAPKLVGKAPSSANPPHRYSLTAV